VDLHVHEAGQQRDVAQVDLRCLTGHTRAVDRDDPVLLDDDHGGRSDLAGDDVDPAVGPENGGVAHLYGLGSVKESNDVAPESGTRGWNQTSTGNETSIIE